MSQASIVINISDQEHIHSNGLSGTWKIPAKKPDEKFAILVVYPTPEIQDIGDERKTVHWLKAAPLAHDIVGVARRIGGQMIGPDQFSAGSKEKWGILLCGAEPDLPKELLDAQEAEIEYLNMHPLDIKMRVDPVTKATVATNLYNSEPGEFDKRVELSLTVELLREAFVKHCRTLVTAAEIQRAKANLLREDQRLIAEGDMMWAEPSEHRNISTLHRRACGRVGQERPWAYVPQLLVDCPGCGAKIRENILKCPACNGWLDEGLEKLAVMDPKQRRIKMYPEQFEREPVAATGAQKGK
jgi:hypothetical protein